MTRYLTIFHPACARLQNSSGSVLPREDFFDPSGTFAFTVRSLANGEPRRMAMTHTFMTKILSLAAMAALLTICVLFAVPKNPGGKLGSQAHATSLR